MSPTPDNGALSDVSCRIVVLSSSIAQATSLINSIRSRDNAHSLPTDKETNPEAQVHSSEFTIIPWTIVNKYYTATVHFAARPVHGLSPHQVRDIPSLIFVWARGESYKDHIERISHDLGGHEPEVCLAIRMSADSSILGEEVQEDDTQIDAFLTAHGFEYIKIVDDAADSKGDNDDFEQDIPGLPRVLDALSTIMWPSMRVRARGASKKIDRHRGRAVLDWAQDSQDSHSDDQFMDRFMERRQDIEELRCWLKEDESLNEDPWKSASVTMTVSPISMDFGDTDIQRKAAEAMPGFDDNFTIFISAPPVENGGSTPDRPFENEANLSIPDGGDWYHTLGSDFGSDDGENGDESYPTEEEIVATSRRIFGKEGTLQAGEDLDELKMVPFDLTQVVGVLEEMKAEIGKLEDEEERRRAAARVALGFVYGLEGDG